MSTLQSVDGDVLRDSSDGRAIARAGTAGQIVCPPPVSHVSLTAARPDPATSVQPDGSANVDVNSWRCKYYFKMFFSLENCLIDFQFQAVWFVGSKLWW